MALWRQRPRPSGQNGYRRNGAGDACGADRACSGGEEARLVAGAVGRPVRRTSKTKTAPGSPAPLGAVAKTQTGGGAGQAAGQAEASQTTAGRDREDRS